MADIRKRKGAKGVTYQVRYPSKSSASGYAYATFDTLKEAKDFVESGKAKQAGAKRAGSIDTVFAAIDNWLKICEKIGRDGREKVEPQTLVEYTRRTRIMKEYPWSKALQELEPSDVVHFRNWLLEHKGRDLARRTLSSFHSVLIEMRNQGHIKNDPCAGITVRSGGRYEDDDAEVEIPSDIEMRAILSAADRMGEKNKQMKKCWSRYRPMIYLAAFSGMRPSEYRGLPWSALLEDRVLVRQRADKTGIIGPVKSKAGRRTIYLPIIVTEMLFAWQKTCPHSDLDLVFPTETGKPQMLSNFYCRAWLPLMREAGLVYTEVVKGKVVQKPKYSPYALRHFFASKLIEKGTDLKFIQETMGHSRIEITLNVYGHLIKDREDARKQTVEALISDLLDSSCGKSVANTA